MRSTGKDDEKDEKERVYAERILFSDNSPCSNQVKKDTICDAKLLDVSWMESMKGDKHLKLLGKL